MPFLARLAVSAFVLAYTGAAIVPCPVAAFPGSSPNPVDVQTEITVFCPCGCENGPPGQRVGSAWQAPPPSAHDLRPLPGRLAVVDPPRVVSSRSPSAPEPVPIPA